MKVLIHTRFHNGQLKKEIVDADSVYEAIKDKRARLSSRSAEDLSLIEAVEADEQDERELEEWQRRNRW